MSDKTLADCARCPMVSHCTAHVTGGSWDFTKGVDPCRIKMSEDEDHTAWRIQ